MKIVCGECGGDGVAEYIGNWQRPCDACRGEGELDVPIIWAAIILVSNWLKRRAA